MISLGVVALLHVGLGYAFITGLALKAVKAIVQPLETVNVKEEKPPPEEPPPPPPKDVEIPPYVPPPEVTVAQSTAPTITTQTAVPQPEPPKFVPPAPPQPVEAPKAAPTAATDKGRGNTMTDDDFPDASRRAEEQGTTRVSFTIGTDGKVSACSTVQSSGFPRLDDAACKIIIRRWRFNPAMRDGQPVPETRQRPIRWVLKNN